MLNFVKGIYQIFRCIREFVLSLFFILFVMLCFSFVAFFTSDSQTKKASFPVEKGALTLNLDGYLADNHDELNELRRLLRSEFNGNDPVKISVFDAVRAVAKAAEDEKISGLVLDLRYFEGGDLPSLGFLGKEIQNFKTSGKPVIAIGEQYDQAQYYLASFADKIYLNKAGAVDLHGLSYSNFYFKALLDKIEAIPHIFRVGTYKSAVEPFLRDDMSPEAKQNAEIWLQSVWNNVRRDIALNRAIPAENVAPETAQYIEQYKKLKGDDAQLALKQKWVTHIATGEEIRQALIEQFGKDGKGNYNSINYFDYESNLSDRFTVRAGNKIAVVNVEGQIILGESDENSAGSDTIVKLLHEANLDPNVRGVILRINSPGGSAVASELIRQEVETIQKSGKPVVASMGGMAASGGYWIAATSNSIIAAPTTITGSIGIFGLAVSFEKTAKNLGVSEDGIATSPLARQTAFKPLSQEQSELIQIGIENGYDRFLTLVGHGRNMSKAQVDKVAQGQVWSGEDALKHGLVDKLGDFSDAYNTLVELININRLEQNLPAIEQFGTQWFIDSDDSLFGSLMKNLKAGARLKLAAWFNLPLPAKSGDTLEKLNRFNDPKNTYLYCLNCGSLQ